MALQIGTRVGPFELTGTLGSGGMGEVYRARDSKLGRDVALKILPDHLVDPDRLARFTREAQVVASLSHPNIGAIHGLEQIDGRPVLVLELIEGPTLADRIAQGPLPQDEAVSIARQIAEALEAAHEQGVVHRDLKPANVKLRPDGLVKVLDFGLAKLAGPPEGGHYVQDDRSVRLQADQSPTLSPTITSPAMTGIGLILGTAAYMSPEQAAGKPADKRADIWSFGVVLWEMLTGQRLFGDGESTSHVLADVLRAPIDFEKIPAGPLRELLRRCLDRNVKTRLRDIGEARVVLGRPIEPATVVREVAAPRRGVIVPWAVAALLAVAIGVEDWAPWRAEPADQPLVRLLVDLGSDVALPASTLGQTVAISPDGARIMYIASVAGGRDRLYVRRLADDEDRSVELPGSEGVTAATFSPDGKSVAFVVANRVYRASVDGGAALRLADIQAPGNQITWGEGDVILVSGIRMALSRIPAGSGVPVPLTQLAGSELIHAAPQVLPGGKTVLFVAGGPTDTTTIEAVPAGGGMRKVIIPNGLSPQYIPTGHLLYSLRNTLFAVRFNPETLVTSGDPVPLLDDIKTTYSGLVAVSGFSVSGNGTLVYRRATGEQSAPLQPMTTVDWVEGTKRTPLVSTEGTYFDPRVSPDGTRLLITVLRGPGPDIAIYDSRRDSSPRNFTFDAASVDPVWVGKDGRYVVFLNLGAGGNLQGFPNGGLRWARTDGGSPQPLLPGVRVVSAGTFSPEASRLAYVGREGEGSGQNGRRNIFTVTLTEENGQLKAGAPERFSPSQFMEAGPRFSPDGKWIAFVSDRTGREEVFVRALDAPAGGVRYERQVSSGGGASPRWSRSRSELLFQFGDQIVAVPFIVKDNAWEPIAQPVVRVEKLGSTLWDLAPDGRIAVVTPVGLPPGEKPSPPEHTVAFLQNFFAEVRRRVK